MVYSIPAVYPEQQQWAGYYEPQAEVPVVTAPTTDVSAPAPSQPPAAAARTDHTSSIVAHQDQNTPLQTLPLQHATSISGKKKATKTLLIYNNNELSPVSNLEKYKNSVLTVF